jgi:hypothetical protein
MTQNQQPQRCDRDDLAEVRWALVAAGYLKPAEDAAAAAS